MAGLPGTTCRRRIYLMRHGDVSYFDAQGTPLDPRHVPLTEIGRQHVQSVASGLAPVRFDRAICSGLVRTRETAGIVLGNRKRPLEEDGRLKEIRAGRLRDIPEAERESLIGYAYDQAGRPDATFIGGERWTDFRDRVLAAWSDWLADDSWTQLLAVTHDAVNRVLLAEVAGVGLAGLRVFEQEPACINVVEVDVVAGRLQRGYLRAVNLLAYDGTRDANALTVMEKVHRQYVGR